MRLPSTPQKRPESHKTACLDITSHIGERPLKETLVGIYMATSAHLGGLGWSFGQEGVVGKRRARCGRPFGGRPRHKAVRELSQRLAQRLGSAWLPVRHVRVLLHLHCAKFLSFCYTCPSRIWHLHKITSCKLDLEGTHAWTCSLNLFHSPCACEQCPFGLHLHLTLLLLAPMRRGWWRWCLPPAPRGHRCGQRSPAAQRGLLRGARTRERSRACAQRCQDRCQVCAQLRARRSDERAKP